MSLIVRECAPWYAMIALDVRRGKLRGATLFATGMFAIAILCDRGKVQSEVCAGSKSKSEAWCDGSEIFGNELLGYCESIAAIGEVCDALVEG